MISFLSDMGLEYDRMFSSVDIVRSRFDEWGGVLFLKMSDEYAKPP